MVTRVAVGLMCLAFACATPDPGAPREYRDGAPLRPPPAPAMRPGVGAPQVGQPGVFEPREYPRSPYTRVLPEDEKTRQGPGLWGAEVPKAVSDENLEKGRKLFLRFVPELPLPKDPTPTERAYGDKCAGRSGLSLSTASGASNKSLEEWLKAMAPEERVCILGRLFLDCLGDESTKLPEDAKGSLARSIQSAFEFKKAGCGRALMTGQMEWFYMRANKILHSWYR